jgi:hypothetical protein
MASSIPRILRECNSGFLLSSSNILTLPHFRIYWLFLYYGYVLNDVINEPGDPFLHKTATAVNTIRIHRYIMVVSDKPRPTGRFLQFQNAIHHSTLNTHQLTPSHHIIPNISHSVSNSEMHTTLLRHVGSTPFIHDQPADSLDISE